MKIFSLETKKHLVGWSLVFGFILKQIAYSLTVTSSYCGDDLLHDACKIYGYPYKVPYSYMGEMGKDYLHWVNLLFWILVILIILSIIRHVKSRSMSTK